MKTNIKVLQLDPVFIRKAETKEENTKKLTNVCTLFLSAIFNSAASIPKYFLFYLF